MELISFPSGGLKLQGRFWQVQDISKPAIIFCHDAFERSTNWDTYALLLHNIGFNTITFDFVGHGESEGLRSLVDLEIWAYNIRDVLNAMSRYGFRRFALIGLGCGGSAALLAAAHDPRLEGVAVLAAPVNLLPPFGERVAYLLISLVASIKKALFHKPLRLSRLNELDNLSIIEDETLNAAYLAEPQVRGMFQAVPIPESLDSAWMDIRAAVKKIQIPILVLHGENDRLIPLAQSELLIELLAAEKRLEIIPGSGHALHLDSQSSQVFNILASFIKQLA